MRSIAISGLIFASLTQNVFSNETETKHYANFSLHAELPAGSSTEEFRAEIQKLTEVASNRVCSLQGKSAFTGEVNILREHFNNEKSDLWSDVSAVFNCVRAESQTMPKTNKKYKNANFTLTQALNDLLADQIIFNAMHSDGCGKFHDWVFTPKACVSAPQLPDTCEILVEYISNNTCELGAMTTVKFDMKHLKTWFPEQSSFRFLTKDGQVLFEYDGFYFSVGSQIED